MRLSWEDPRPDGKRLHRTREHRKQEGYGHQLGEPTAKRRGQELSARASEGARAADIFISALWTLEMRRGRLCALNCQVCGALFQRPTKQTHLSATLQGPFWCWLKGTAGPALFGPSSFCSANCFAAACSLSFFYNRFLSPPLLLFSSSQEP